jgi:hypothetical protein
MLGLLLMGKHTTKLIMYRQIKDSIQILLISDLSEELTVILTLSNVCKSHTEAVCKLMSRAEI